MKNLPNDFIYILITLGGCVAINGAENFKKHLFEVCPAIESELKIWFESDEKELRKLNELLDDKFTLLSWLYRAAGMRQKVGKSLLK